MAKVPLQKVRITGLKKHYKSLMQELHRSGHLHIVENSEFIEGSRVKEDLNFFDVFDLAKIEFMIGFLEQYAPKKSMIHNLLTGGKLLISEEKAKLRLKAFAPKAEGIANQCSEIEERVAKSKNEIKKADSLIAKLTPYAEFSLPLAESYSTKTTTTLLGVVSKTALERLLDSLHQQTNLVDVEVLMEGGKDVSLRVTAPNDSLKGVQELLSEVQFDTLDIIPDEFAYYGYTVAEILSILEEKKGSLESEIVKSYAFAKELAVHLEDAQILYDYNLWRKTKNDLQKTIYRGENIFAFDAWMPTEESTKLGDWISKVFVGEVSFDKVEKDEDEKVPVLMENAEGLDSFESITEMYGVPQEKDIDPTSYLAPCFVIFFGICLSDVGYGAMLALFSGWLLLFGKFEYEVRKTMRLVFACGVSAVIGGVLLGSWFSMSPEFAPSFLVADAETGRFIGQILNPLQGSGSLTFLIFTLYVGIAQLLFGVLLDFYKHVKQGKLLKGLMDPMAWFYFLVSLVLFGTASQTGFPEEIAKNMAIAGAVILILTQGRHEKNWLLKPLMGVLGLYGVMDYLSNILSYSRLMALGLATGVIGFAMNTTAGVIYDMIGIPVVSTIAAAGVLIFGHGLNFGLSFLGAFIHSMRLQFIEFFGRFYVGGGLQFKPFVRAKKYIHFRS